jgi:hypothetical protein
MAHRARRAWRRALVVAVALSLMLVAGQLARSSPPEEESGPAALPTTTAAPAPSGDRFVRPDCPVSAKLVPACGRWWGVSAAAHSDTPLTAGLAAFERDAGRPMDIVHTYHREDTELPTAEQIALAREPGRHRLLFLNWKPSLSHTWREVADGAIDARIDALARHVRAAFPERFFLTIWHEPENDVDITPGSGMSASDYRAMFRHVVLRLRDGGVTNAVIVMNYMGSRTWGAEPWFERLYPGDDVVDWIGFDPYVEAWTEGKRPGDFADLVDRRGLNWPGFYTWWHWYHRKKPLMLAEWGIYASEERPERQALAFRTVAAQIGHFAEFKALVYFDTRLPGEYTAIDRNSEAREAYRRLGRSTPFVAPAVP